MSVADLIVRLTERLDRSGIPYMVVGSFASTYRGLPRTTQDLDVVIDPSPQSLKAFLSLLPKLEWAALGESERQLRDVQNIVDVKADSLDEAEAASHHPPRASWWAST